MSDHAAGVPPPPVPPPPGPQAAPHMGQDPAVALYRSRAGWFYWLAGLSLVNSILLHTGMGIQFIFGLGLTSVVDAVVLGDGAPSAGTRMIGLGLDAVIAAVFAAFGFATIHLGWRWALWVGLVLYAVDAVLCLMAGAWIELAVHAYVLFQLGLAAVASLKLPPGPVAQK